ncbi:hypothetical protein PsAD2_00384 [Pseudovibrio axinellae]|uniref:DUF924 domain-containing protein n=1 Tax=Pseudovibrio axinellae TaxID=989403 RepID=A0A161V9R7_9HYPH|nr:DUF924 family protein [Pseudovibrio axinellae]KZL21760.1 hypothetical protein PsAD2_00384 [Pseudovibrio axinellae]SEQ22267.1 Uncharacterized conserved protein, DUF924 family [Pseudovibrio axinellae]
MSITEDYEKVETDKALEILDFWWSAGGPKWFNGGEEFDIEIREKFEADVEAADRGEYNSWTSTPHGTLALILLFDQFPRNIFRGTPKAFAFDAKALRIALESLNKNFHKAFPKGYRTFFFLPFEHSEEMDMQDLSVELFKGLDDQDTYHYALIHMDVIRRFGRFPHRNKVLGRTSTPIEVDFLASGGFSA